MSFKRILVAVDGSETGGLALNEAILLAKNAKAALRIIHVEDEYHIGLADVPFDYRDALIKEIKKEGIALLAKVKAIAVNSGLPDVETKLAELKQHGQRVSEIIAEEAKHWSADLLVLGTHGRRGISHLFLGSVAEHVARISPVPVLLVRPIRS